MFYFLNIVHPLFGSGRLTVLKGSIMSKKNRKCVGDESIAIFIHFDVTSGFNSGKNELNHHYFFIIYFY